MLEMRNLLQKKINKKGFTLAELLVVVAIIAILVAVSIPIFAGKLNDARENTDLANERAAKAAAVNEYLQDEALQTAGDYTGYYDAENGTLETASSGIEAYGKSSDNDGEIVKVKVTESGKKVTASWEKPTA